MSASDDVLRVVGDWITKAENDLRAAALTLREQRNCPTDTICFHAQQCVEKYLKALLVLRGTPFPKTHSLADISALLPDEWQPDVPPKVLERFTDYATITRYPGEYAEISLEEARAALSIARRIRKATRSLVPAASLRRRRRA